jgi:clan AA aspartic protease (TIGR02281 family)
MTAQLPIIASRHGLDALGRQILGAVTGVAIATGFLLYRPADTVGVPPLEMQGGPGHSLMVPAGTHGFCVTDLWIGNRPLEAITDSGADGSIIIGRNQATKAGIDTGQLHFTWPFQSPGGSGHYAHIHVQRLRIGDNIELDDVPVDVNENDQQQALIGVEVLRQLNFRIRPHGCQLRQGGPA